MCSSGPQPFCISFMEDKFSMDGAGGMFQGYYIYYATNDLTGGRAQVVR